MPNVKSQIESLLFISNKPFSLSKLAQILQVNTEEAEAAIKELMAEYNKPERGVQIMRNGREVQMVTGAENTKIVREFLKDEMTGELTQPALETLTIVAYRGPMTKAELEQIRGVNCSLILRNLMIKGLVETTPEKQAGEFLYRITFDFMRYLGISETKELPDFDKLSQAEVLGKLLSEVSQNQEPQEQNPEQISGQKLEPAPEQNEIDEADSIIE